MNPLQEQHTHPKDPPVSHLTANPTKWLPEHDAMLKEKVEQKKYSYAQIAADINERFGTTYSRNSVIGRANRLRLNNTRPDQNLRPQGRNRPKLRIVRAAGNSNNLKVIESIERDNISLIPPARALNLTLEDLPESGCRFVTTNEAPWLYCGLDRKPDSSFCRHCHSIVWLPPTERNQARRGFR